MKTFKEFFQLGVTKPSKSDVQNYLNGLGTRLMQLSDIKKKIITHFKNIKNLKLDSFGRKVLSFEEYIPEEVEEAKQGHALVVGGKIVARGSKSALLKKVKKDKIKLDPKGDQNFLTYTGKEVGDSW
jgi:hypothetical protein